MEWTTKMEGGGTLYLRDDGHCMYLEANRPEDGRGLYKVILQGIQGGQVLGTMEPSEKGLKLSRMVSRSTMGQWGCLPLSKVICQLTYPFPEEKEEPLEEAEVFSAALLEQIQEEESFRPVEESSDSPEQEHKTEESWTEVALPEEIPEEIQYEGGFSPCSHGEQWMKDGVLADCLSRCHDVLRSEREGGFALAIPFEGEFPMIPLFCLAQKLELGTKTYLGFCFAQDGRPKPYF